MTAIVRAVQAADRSVATLIQCVGVVLLGALCLLINGAIIFRSGLTTPIAWSGEIAAYLNFWLVFIGASLGTRRALDFRIDYFYYLLPRSMRRAVSLLTNAICLVALVVLIISSVHLLSGLWQVRTSASDIPAPVPYSAVLVGACLLLLNYLRRLLMTCTTCEESEEGPQ
mgnify:FL=1